MKRKEKINNIKSLINEFYHKEKCEGKLTECANNCWKSYQKDCDEIKQDLERFEELVKIIRILKKRKYAEWIKTKFYDEVGYNEEQEKLFKKVFGSSWRKF